MKKTKAKIFSDGEKKFLIDPNKVNTRQRGSYKKRVKERLQEIGGDHFKIALSYVPTKERLDLIKNVLESLPISSSEVKTFLKYQYSNVEDIENSTERYSKEAFISHNFWRNRIKEVTKGDLSWMSFLDVINLIKRLRNLKNTSKREIMREINLLKNSKEFIFGKKSKNDRIYFKNNKRAKTLFKKIKNKKEECKNKSIPLHDISTYKKLVRMGLLECQVTKSKGINLLDKIRNELRKNSFKIDKKEIVPFKGICKGCKKTCKWELSEYGKSTDFSKYV